VTEAGRGFVVWFTGLSGAGKSTLAELLVSELQRRGHRVELLDGDVVRTNLSKGLGFSKEDRDTNILRIGFVAHLLSRNGVAAVVSAISPYREIRDQVRDQVGDFVEVFCDAPLDVLIERDVKGLYRKAMAGEIKEFTGISDPYEPPEAPEVVVHSDRESVEASLRKIIETLESLGYTPATEDSLA
jgi:adenylylsulfate kinase